MLGSMCEAMRSRVWSSLGDLTVGEMAIYIQWTHSLRLERDAHAYSSRCCERDDRYSVGSVMWSLAYRNTQSVLFE